MSKPARKPAATPVERAAAYRQRLAAAGEPPAWRVANAVVAALVEAKVAGDATIPVDLVIDRAAGILAADERFKRDGVLAVFERACRPRSRRRRAW